MVNRISIDKCSNLHHGIINHTVVEEGHNLWMGESATVHSRKIETTFRFGNYATFVFCGNDIKNCGNTSCGCEPSGKFFTELSTVPA